MTTRDALTLGLLIGLIICLFMQTDDVQKLNQRVDDVELMISLEQR